MPNLPWWSLHDCDSSPTLYMRDSMERTWWRFFFFRSSWRISWIISFLMCSWFTMNVRIIWWSLDTSSQNFAPLSRFWAVDGCPLLRLSSWSSHPSLYLWNCSKTCMRQSFISIKILKHFVHSSRCVTQVWNRTWCTVAASWQQRKMWLLHRAAVDAVTDLQHFFLR